MSGTAASVLNAQQVLIVDENRPQPVDIFSGLPDPVLKAMCTCSSPKFRRSGMTGAALEQRFRQACQGSLPDFVTAMNP
ncbi:hypothetical protein [Azotobacter salinestris]|uniref:hypothetical protein n=1 Tax=Azotobacter salinestris TaxID=69964 RepID=UPI0032DFAE2A